MAGRAIWRRQAEEDLTDAYLHIGVDSPTAAERLLDAVEEAVQLLLENTRVGRLREFRSPRAQGVRSWGVRGFESYLIFYRLDGEDIEIVRFIHGARDVPRLLGGESWPMLLFDTHPRPVPDSVRLRSCGATANKSSGRASPAPGARPTGSPGPA